ncbi:phage portal protein family protein [Bacteroides fragilis]|uniref:phage portal protein family protein n=1 Tax=Bacteroides fragilis TaxID=817 RepID=UPI00202DD006|nr:DUF935 family protein [Bacteroides fragilis]MCM0301266.1 DUF935 family protein [Bacteroides fragilis]MCM0315934.1 DUF935 family protein [Bacteroides fragilis]DAI45808.1 MAG TPA: portal [Caudoviricetes sp.]
MSGQRNPDRQNMRVGKIDLARPAERKRVTRLAVNLQLQTEALTKKDLRTWRNAWQYAINTEYPNRVPLYDVYGDVEVDMHLTGCVGQRKGYVLNKSFRIVDKAGIENPDLTAVFESPWFKTFMELALESIFWGHSLIQLGDIIEVEGVPAFKEVLLVPRRHVIPEYGVIVTHQQETWQNGYDYRNSDMADWIVEVGGTHDLGLYLKCAQHTIPKKNVFSFWDMFSEIFGIPFRVGKTTSRDPKEQGRIEKMLGSMGAAGWALFPEGTEIEIKESTRGDAYNVFDRRVERANSELSKGTLTQTMTTDNGSSLSQSEVHKEMLMNLIQKDADLLRDIINFQLIPKMIKHGFPLKGFRFDWYEGIDFTPEQQIAYERMLLENYEVDANYFIDKYNVPILKPRQKPAVQLVKPFFD